MGFDGYGPSQVPRPAKPVEPTGFLADLARRQRNDDRRLDDASGVAEVAARTATTQISTGTLNGSGIGSASFTVPDVGTTVVWVQAVALVSGITSGDDAELWVHFSGSGIQGSFAYGKQPSAVIGLGAVGATVAGRASVGATIALNLACPIEPSESFTATFHASPAR